MARDPADRLEKVGHFVEMTATTLAVLVLGWYQTRGAGQAERERWDGKLNRLGITLGEWNSVVESAHDQLTRAPHDPVARAILLACEAALPGLKRYGPLRNRYAHGGRPRLRNDQERAATELAAAVPLLLDAMAPLTSLRLAVVRGSTQRGPAWLIDADLASGAFEQFTPRQMDSTSSYAPGTVVAFHGGSLSHAIVVSPFCICAQCPSCPGRDELFYLHQRKRRKDMYSSFSTGHSLIVQGQDRRPDAYPEPALGLRPVGGVRAAASSGWRANWAVLASRSSRIAARSIDLAAVGVLGVLAWVVARAGGLLTLPAAGVALVPVAAYEPAAALAGGTLGKRLLRLEPISVWDSRPLGRADAIRRAVFADAQLLFPPLALRNLAWVLWDPARQCLHDRRARCIVVTGRTEPWHKA